ncbi:hypothetical protein ACFFK8_05270 [Hallella seregens ATCC 51272]|uniref:Uncharacterized protein n=1 Tax=Hallella seregens ATCC 51272 TaxID=1336250 RepID=A0ABV5ZIP2_9BACT
MVVDDEQQNAHHKTGHIDAPMEIAEHDQHKREIERYPDEAAGKQHHERVPVVVVATVHGQGEAGVPIDKRLEDAERDAEGVESHSVGLIFGLCRQKEFG